jgi:chromosome segregation ATPase
MTKTNVGLAILMMVLIGAWAGGCQEGNAGDTGTTAEVKRERLLSAENGQLKAQAEALSEQVEQLKQQIAKCEQEKIALGEEVKQQIAKCEKEKSTLCEQERQQLAQCEQEKQTQEKELNDKANEMLQGAAENTAKLVGEIEALKAEIAKLKGR